MISEIFFAKDIKCDPKKLYKYSDDFVFYSICSFLSKNGALSARKIIELLCSEFSVPSVSASKLTFVLRKFPKNTNDEYFLFDFENALLKKTDCFKKSFATINSASEGVIVHKLSSFISQRRINIADAMPWLFALDKISSEKDESFYHFAFFNALRYQDYYYMEIDRSISDIDESYKPLTIDFLFKDKTITNALFVSGINTLGELFDLSIDSIMLLFSCNLRYNIELLKSLSVSLDQLPKLILDIFYSLNEKERDVIIRRQGLNGFKEETLEEVAKLYKLTRERVRQMEAKAYSKIKAKISTLTHLFVCLYFKLIKPGRKYLLRKEVQEYFNDELVAGLTALFIFLSDSFVTYDFKLGIIYDRKNYSLNDITNEIINNYGVYIIKKDYEDLDELERAVIGPEYRLVDSAVYVRRGFPNRALSTEIIDSCFPNGYHISDDGDFEKFKSEYIRRYGYWDEMLCPRVITAYLDHDGYCLIGRGTYINKEYAHKLTDELRASILNYILENQPAVYYRSIYSFFESNLKLLGINNYYYLKGVLDPTLPEEFTTKRDYIQVGQAKMTAIQTILMFMKSFEGTFTLMDLRQRFEGVKDYVFTNLLYKEIEKGLIWLSSKEYIYLDKIGLPNSTRKNLSNFIDGLFKSLNTDVLSSRKIYAKLVLTDRNLFDELKIVKNQFSLFSLLNYLFHSIYYFNRPLISKNINYDAGSEKVIKDYVSTLEEFNARTIYKYTSNMSIRGLYSYSRFMDELSDDYVQINIDTMVKKEKVGVTNDLLKEFEDIFRLIFSNCDIVDTRNFNGYAILPKFNYGWSKHLLVGIIRTFLSDKYEVENTESTYDTTDYIIRKLS